MPEDTSPSHTNTPESPFSPDMIPQETKGPSNMRYVWLSVVIFLVLSVVGVGAYVIDAGSQQKPSEVNILLTPTPDMPNAVRKPTDVPTIVESATTATPSSTLAPENVKSATRSGTAF